MLIRELVETVVSEFESFDKWSSAAKKAGGVKHVKSSDKQRIYAVDQENKPVKHAYGMWDERDNKGTLFSFKKKLIRGVDYDD